jgi:hypothetical protein
MMDVPGETDNNPYAYFGKSTFSADLSQYQDQFVHLIPEPSTFLLLTVSLGAMCIRRKRI